MDANANVHHFQDDQYLRCACLRSKQRLGQLSYTFAHLPVYLLDVVDHTVDQKLLLIRYCYVKMLLRL